MQFQEWQLAVTGPAEDVHGRYGLPKVPAAQEAHREQCVWGKHLHFVYSHVDRGTPFLDLHLRFMRNSGNMNSHESPQPMTMSSVA